MNKIKRCRWCNQNNPQYVEYHDNEWGQQNLNEHYLYEMFILETFQAGLSWECILNKREYFRKAFDNFDIEKIISYNAEKIEELINNPQIVRNKLKIIASIENSKIYYNIMKEFGSFGNYLKNFAGDEVIYDYNHPTSHLSNIISTDLKKRGMKFVGSVTIHSYLQAIGLIYSHEPECFLYKTI